MIKRIFILCCLWLMVGSSVSFGAKLAHQWEYVKTDTGDSYYVDMANMRGHHKDNSYFVMVYIKQNTGTAYDSIFAYEFRLKPLETDEESGVTAPPQCTGMRILEGYVINAGGRELRHARFPFGNKWYPPDDLGNRFLAVWYEDRIDREYAEGSPSTW